MVQFRPIIACICEGGAEATILDILLDNNLLRFTRENLLDEEVLRERNATTFANRYLRKEFDSKITVIRILDSRRENFKIGKAYQHKVDAVINVLTTPEIEMLVILNENRYKEYSKSGKKPSSFCKENLKMANVKSPEFIKDYFKDSYILVKAIREYGRISKIKKNEYTFLDLLK